MAKKRKFPKDAFVSPDIVDGEEIKGSFVQVTGPSQCNKRAVTVFEINGGWYSYRYPNELKGRAKKLAKALLKGRAKKLAKALLKGG